MNDPCSEAVLTDRQRDLAFLGKCPYCERPVKGFKPVFGYFAPEWFAAMRENGIDPSNGHKESCGHKDIRL